MFRIFKTDCEIFIEFLFMVLDFLNRNSLQICLFVDANFCAPSKFYDNKTVKREIKFRRSSNSPNFEFDISFCSTLFSPHPPCASLEGREKYRKIKSKKDCHQSKKIKNFLSTLQRKQSWLSLSIFCFNGKMSKLCEKLPEREKIRQ